MPTVYINRFDRGITNDPRNQLDGTFRVITNFDTLTSPRLAIPYRSSEDGDSGSVTSKKQNFAVGLGASSTWRIFGLGVVSGTGRAEVNFKNLTTGASTDLDDNGWGTPSNNASSVGSTEFNLFVYYKKTGMFYGARSGTRLWKFDPTGSTAWDDDYQTISYTNVAQGLVHSKDDILYIPYDNVIATLNNTSWNATALTLPSHLYITSICEYGNYLAIACAPLSGVGSSRVYLWDRDSTLTTVTESIDWGEGVIKIMEETDGVLIGISLSGNNSTRNNAKIIFKYYTPSGAVKFNEILGGSSAQLPIYKQKIDNRVYFQASITINGATREGLWSVGRSNPNEPFAVIHERTPNNDTALTNGVLTGFFIVGDYVFQSYVDNSNYGLTKTDDQAIYSHTSIIETTINPKMPEVDRPKKKKLISAGLLYESLPSSGQAILKYKTDGGAYTTVVTETVDGSVVTESPNAGGTSYSEGRDFEFKIDVTGGVKIAGIYYTYNVVPTGIQ